MAYYDYGHGSVPRGMDLSYQPLLKQASDLQNKFHVRMEDRFNPISRSLQSETSRLVEDISANRTPQELEDRVRTIQGHLFRAQGMTDGPIMSDESRESLSRGYGRLRTELQNTQAPRVKATDVATDDYQSRRSGYTPYAPNSRPGSLPSYRSKFRPN